MKTPHTCTGLQYEKFYLILYKTLTGSQYNLTEIFHKKKRIKAIDRNLNCYFKYRPIEIYIPNKISIFSPGLQASCLFQQ